MEKETLLTGLKNVLGEPGTNGYFGDTGVTTRTLDAYLDALLPTITSDKMVDDSFYQSQANVIKAMGGQMRFEQAEFARNYKPKGGEPQLLTPPVSPQAGDNGNGDLLKRLETIERERELEKKNSFEKGLRETILKRSTDLKVSNKKLWEDSVKMVEYKEGMDASSLEAKAKELYESKLKAYLGDGAVPYGGSRMQQIDPEGAKEKREAFKAKMRAQGKLPKAE